MKHQNHKKGSGAFSSALAGLVAIAVLTAASLAVTTSHWTHGNETDFKGGTLHNVVVTNLGDVKLSRAVQTIQDQNPDVTSVNALAEAADGTIYAGTGPKGILLAVKDGKVTTAATLDDTVNILSLCNDDKGAILIGTGGEKGRILRLAKAGDKPTEIFSAPDVQYIWSMVRTDDGNIYAATGPNGQLFEIRPDGSHSELYKSSDDNLTSMIGDGKDQLYAGSDPSGLVIRINRKTKESFIVYNAGESGITALAFDAKTGNLFAGTGEVDERQQPQPPQQAQPAPGGRPEDNSNGAPIPSPAQPAPPKNPTPPNPNPGEPKPIPSKHSRANFDLSNPVYLDLTPTTKSASKEDDENNAPDTSPAAQFIQEHGPHPKIEPNPNEPQKPPGNAIYKIDKDGFVTEIFRQPTAVIYSMIVQNGVLLVGTGSEGEIYQVDPEAGETLVLAKVDVKQILSLLAAKDGRIIMGLANTGGISAMTSGYATDGTYISQVLDATQVSKFGKIQLHGQLPDGTTLKLATRSGNVKDADSTGWSKWSDDASATEFMKITAPSARFLQYRLTFATTQPTKTPVVDHVDVAYQLPNLPPEVKSVKIGQDQETAAPPNAVAAPNAPANNAPKSAGTGTQTVTWEASDPNGDALIYRLYFRLEGHGDWIILKDKVKEATYDWDTKNVSDGRYQIKVVASDAAANPPGQGKTGTRISSVYVVDNTPPVIGDITTTIANHEANVQCTAQDETSIVSNIEYTVDSRDDWQMVLPTDGIFDDQRETVKFTIKGLTPGSHQLTIRATDSKGNQALSTISIKMD